MRLPEIPYVSLQRLRRTVERARAHDFMNVGFGQRFTLQHNQIAPGVWPALFTVGTLLVTPTARTEP